jgi:hypothetical protein
MVISRKTPRKISIGPTEFMTWCFSQAIGFIRVGVSIHNHYILYHGRCAIYNILFHPLIATTLASAVVLINCVATSIFIRSRGSGHMCVRPVRPYDLFSIVHLYSRFESLLWGRICFVLKSTQTFWKFNMEFYQLIRVELSELSGFEW